MLFLATNGFKMALIQSRLWRKVLPSFSSKSIASFKNIAQQSTFSVEHSLRRLSSAASSTVNSSSNGSEVKNPSNFNKVQYGVPKEDVGRVLGKEKQTVNEIKALSGSVIRLKKYQDAHDDPDKGYFVIGGNDEQIKKAKELIERAITKRPGTGRREEDGAPIWSTYRRNFKGQFPPQHTRRQCIRFGGKSVSGNPCPLCKLQLEENREVDYKDPGLLKEFICPHTWKVLQPSTTGVCRTQQRKLESEIQKSRLYGLLPFTITLPDDSPIPHKPAGIPRKTARIRY